MRPYPVTLIRASIKSNTIKNALTLPVSSKLAKMLGWLTKEPFPGIQFSWFEPEPQFEVTIYRKELEVRSAVFGSLKKPQLLGELIPHQHTATPSGDLLQAKPSVCFSAIRGGQRKRTAAARASP